MSTQEREVDVAIVGYGPVGAFTALLLAEEGLRVAVFERSTELVDQPRAVGFDSESVRSYQRIGLEEEVVSLLQPRRSTHEVTFANSKREVLFGLDIPEFGTMGWQDISYFDQPEFEAWLREVIACHERIDVRLGHDVVAFEQCSARVVLRARELATGVESAWGAQYLVGCDGASSFVRRTLGIDWQSLGYDQDWLVVDIMLGPDGDLPETMMQVCDPARITTYVPVKDPNRRWEFQLVEGETPLEMVGPERVESLLAPWLPREHYTLRRAAVYQFHAATASRWREGRVFLAGDSAHQTPPFLGQGLNSGFRDAVNLGWKIPLVCGGVCDEALLESYEQERDAHARDLVDWAVAIGKLMETIAAREAGLPDPHESADASAGYGQGRTVPPLRSGAFVLEQMGDRSSVGVPLCQPIVRRRDGTELRLDGLLGRGFVIVGRTRDDLRLGPEAEAVWRGLDGRLVSLEGLEPVRGRFDVLFEQHPAAVLRPDRYVFGVVDDGHDLDALVLDLARKLFMRG